MPMRQNGDTRFFNILQRIRVGKQTSQDIDDLRELCKNTRPIISPVGKNIAVTRLCYYRYAVQQCNKLQLDMLSNKSNQKMFRYFPTNFVIPFEISIFKQVHANLLTTHNSPPILNHPEDPLLLPLKTAYNYAIFDFLKYQIKLEPKITIQKTNDCDSDNKGKRHIDVESIQKICTEEQKTTTTIDIVENTECQNQQQQQQFYIWIHQSISLLYNIDYYKTFLDCIGLFFQDSSDSPNSSSTKSKSKSNMDLQNLELIVGARVTLTQNINISKKLVNGATGTITEFVENSRFANMQHLPESVRLQYSKLPVVTFDDPTIAKTCIHPIFMPINKTPPPALFKWNIGTHDFVDYQENICCFANMYNSLLHVNPDTIPQVYVDLIRKNGSEILTKDFPKCFQAQPMTNILTYALPLELGWAKTIHKAQGATLDAIHITIPKTVDIPQGLAYVAISRVKSIDMLRIDNIDSAMFSVDDDVVKFYNDLEKENK